MDGMVHIFRDYFCYFIEIVQGKGGKLKKNHRKV